MILLIVYLYKKRKSGHFIQMKPLILLLAVRFVLISPPPVPCQTYPVELTGMIPYPIQTDDPLLEHLNRMAGLKKRGVKDPLLKFIPALSFSWLSQNEVNHYGPDRYETNIALSASQLLFDGGRTGIERKMAENIYRMSLLEIEKRSTSLFREFLNLLMEAAVAETMMKNSRDSIERMEKFLELSELEYSIGLITEDLLLESRYRFSEQQLSHEALELTAQWKTDELKVYDGKPGFSLFPLPGIREDFDGILDMENGGELSRYLASALSSEPYIREKNLSVQYLELMERQRKRRFIPDLLLKASVSLTQRENGFGYSGFSLALETSFPVPFGSVQAGSSISAKGPLQRERNEVLSLRLDEAGAREREYLSILEMEHQLLEERKADTVDLFGRRIRRIEIMKKRKTLAREQYISSLARRDIALSRHGRGELSLPQLMENEIEVSNRYAGLISAAENLYREETDFLFFCGMEEHVYASLQSIFTEAR